MNYEIEQALRKKVEEWEFNSLKQDVDRLKNENNSLERKCNDLEQKVNNQTEAIRSIISLIVESNVFPETSNLINIQHYL